MLVELRVPELGESITEVQIGEWLKKEGDSIDKDENVVSIESDKATLELPSPISGRLAKILKQNGQTAAVGEPIAQLEPGKAPSPGAAEAKPVEAEPAPEADGAAAAEPQPRETAAPKTKAPAPRVMPAAARAMAEHGVGAEAVKPSGPGGRVLKEDVLREVKAARAPAGAAPAVEREDDVVPMTPLRRTIAGRLVEAQQTAALLTTFNEIDMKSVLDLRRQLGEAFQAKYQVKLGIMSFFVKASIESLKSVAQVNAEIREANIVYHRYYDIGIAIGSGKGLVVPVIRDADRLSFAEIELAIRDFAGRAQENKLKLEELHGGTFTISNGGVYGSLLSTPIVNPPQSAILGLHTIQERPVVLEGNIVARPIMYVALTYDHRLIDGREAVTFLKRIKELVENPARLALGI